MSYQPPISPNSSFPQGQPYSQGQPYPQGQPYTQGQPYPQGQPRPPKPLKRTAPLSMLGIGLTILVVSVIIFVLAILRVAGIAELTNFPANQDYVISLEAQHEYGIYADYSTTCSVHDPSGNQVTLSGVSGSVTANGQQEIATFTAESAGSYTLHCDSTGSELYWGDALSAGDVMGSVTGMIVGVFGGILGLALGIGGFVWLMMRNSKIKQQKALFPGLYQ